jgi:hypothetical protein
MERSDTIADLAAAMARAEAKMTGARKDSTNPFFSSKYADLASIRASCLPAMNDEGLAVWQFPRVASEEAGGPLFVEIETVVTHTSGEFMKDTLRLPAAKTDPQSLGSLISYGRRYALAAVCSVAALDDDAESAVTHDDPATPSPRTEVSKPAASDAPAGALETSRVFVRDIRQKATSTGGTKFTILADDGEKYATFQRDVAELAKAAKETGAELEVVYRMSKYGRDVVLLRDPNVAEPAL